MKKLGIGLFFLFIFCAALYAVMQSNIGRNFIRSRLTDALEKSGYTVAIGRVEGTLPQQIELKQVAIQGNGVDVSIGSMRLQAVLWRFFKGEIAFNQIEAHDVTFNQSPPFSFQGNFRMNRRHILVQAKHSDWIFRGRLNRHTNWVRFTLTHPLLYAKGQAHLDPVLHLESARIQIGSDNLPAPLQGRLLAHLTLTREEEHFKAQGRWQLPSYPLQGRIEATLVGRKMAGEITADPFAKASFDMELTPDGLLAGTNQIAIDNLQALHLPDFYGKLDAKATWLPLDGHQELHFDATATDFYYGAHFAAQKVSLYSDLRHPFLSGLLDIEIEKGHWKTLAIDAAALEVQVGGESWPIRLFAEGNWKHPLEVHLDGAWQAEQKVHIASCDGTFYAHPFALVDPLDIDWGPDRFRLPALTLQLGEASVFLHLERQKEITDAQVKLQQMPLDIFSLNPLDIPIGGLIDLEANVHEENHRLQGKLTASLLQNAPFDATGECTGSFDRDFLQLTGALQVRGIPLFNLNLSLPIHFSLWPFHADLLYHKALKGHIALNGRVEQFLDFINVGPHRLEGNCQCDLTLGNTLSRPRVEGHILFTDGTYENYYTGTHLSHMQADILAQKNKLILRSLTAQDFPGTGTLSAQGEMELNRSNLYPFQLDLTINQLQFTEIDLVTASANGQLHLEGNTTSAIAKGDVQILQSDFLIPDHLPHPLPNLQVIYKNATHPVPPPEPQYRPYPLYLDLHITAPETITIAGRGLASEWKGDFHLGGTYTAPAAKGKLELISGAFNFSSRSFRLTEGSLSLSGVEHELPHINLAGSMETKGITITARLHGPLNNPQITLQSNPPLPLGSIMSHLLFGQDLSEISGFQALQLATSIASLAGTGPDIMESTRRALGVDHLRVITDPTEEGGETVALQVGKYISKGVLVSFTQSAEDSSPDISVEVELKNNFVFQIESDQRQEQAIFTLKRSKNY